MPDLEITATGNVQPAVASLDKLDKALINVNKDANTLNPTLNKVSQSLAGTAVVSNKLDSSLQKTSALLGTGLKTGSNQAAQALTNLGRVAQDAPFGFIGISNNLNPLLESFQRLKAESGSSGAALKALSGSLIGAGGIGLALSAVTAIVSFASVGFGAWTRGMNGSKAALDENAKAAKAAADAYQSIVSSVAKEVGQVEILVNALTKENLSRKQREEAIKELQKISPQYFATLNAEKSTIGQISAAYDVYSRSIVRVIELKTREAQLNKVIEERLALQDKGNKLTNITVDANGKIQKSYNAVLQAQDDFSKKSFNALILTQAEQAKLNQLLQTEAELLRQIGNLRNPSEFNVVAKKVKIKPEKVEAELPKKIDLLPQSESQKLSLSAGATLKPTLNLEPKLNIVITPEQDKKVLDAITKMILSAQINEAIDSAISNIMNNTISSTADAVANALAGGKDTVPRLFDNIIKGIGQQIKELGQYLVKIGIEKLAIDKAIKALGLNPAATIAVGFAAQILGALLINAATKKASGVGQGFATGVRDFQGGGVVTVGERGPERIFLPVHGRVQPNNEMLAYGGGNQIVEVVGVISGDSIRLLQDRTNQRWNRNN
jgi:chemotaxis protein CheY-P-specific phosphatase CheC